MELQDPNIEHPTKDSNITNSTVDNEVAESLYSDMSDTVITKTSEKPEKPKVGKTNDRDLSISWDVSSTEFEAIDFFEIQWKKKEEKRWSGRKITANNCTTIKIPITYFEKTTAYQFKIRWTTQEGVESQFSDISDDVLIEMSQKPGKPKGVTSNVTYLLINWDVSSSDLQVVDFFELHWKKKEERRWSGRKHTDDNCTEMKIPMTDLEKNTAYQFKVRWTTQEGVESQFSDISDDIIIEISQKPGKPKGVVSNVGDLLISWDVPSSDLEAVDFFEVNWKKKEERRWSGRKSTDDNCTTMKIPITDLEKNTAYQFKVRWTTHEGVESPFSDISDDIIIEMSQKPGKPKGVTSNDTDMLISWDVPSSDVQVVDFFELQWKKKDEKRWLGRRNTDDNSTSITIPITELEKNTSYQFKVRWMTKDGLESMFSEISEDVIIVKTKKPDKPKVVRRNDKELVICWDVSPSDLQGIDYFEILWKKNEEKRWSGLKCTDGNSTSIAILITEFQNNSSYQFKVKWTTINGEDSPFSEISDHIMITAPIPTRSPQQPGKVLSSQTTATSAYLEWERPKGSDEVSYYEVKYRACGDVQWLRVNTEQPVEKLHLKNLKSDNNYEFKVRAIFSDDKEGPFSELSGTVTTQQSLATRLKNTATKLSSGNPQIYKLPLTFSEETTNKTAMIRKGRFGKRDRLRPTKTIIVVGATGAGKSTMIDGMINYIVDVAWEDDFRYTITEDEKAKTHLQDIAQTNWITCYEVSYQHGSRLCYNLNIIDTPGFGGTQDLEQDQKIREFLMAPGDQGIDIIDAVCFVTPAPIARLTPTQKYMFDAIQSVFGKYIKDNIFVLITFADCKEPPVLAALKEANVPFQQAFNFNNSALFACSNASELFPQMFWKLSITSFDNFFDELLKVQQRSLQLTSEVIVLRKQIENTIERLQPQINDGLYKLNTMKVETDILQKHKRDIEDNRNFTYVTKEICQRKVDTKPGEYATNCFVCNCTCHLQCGYADENEKAKCYAMGKDGNCTICKGKCHWSKHRKNSFYYETYTAEVQQTYENMKMKYESAVTGEQKQSSRIQESKSAFESVGRSLMSMMKTVRENVNKLEQGALKPNPLNEVSYVKLLIDSEKKEAKYGWEARVKLLEKIKMKAELLQKIPSKGADWTDEDVEKFLKSV